MEDSGDGSLDATASLDSMDCLLIVLGISMGIDAMAWAVVVRVAELGAAEARAVEAGVSIPGPAEATFVEVSMPVREATVAEASMPVPVEAPAAVASVATA